MGISMATAQCAAPNVHPAVSAHRINARRIFWSNGLTSYTGNGAIAGCGAISISGAAVRTDTEAAGIAGCSSSAGAAAPVSRGVGGTDAASAPGLVATSEERRGGKEG